MILVSPKNYPVPAECAKASDLINTQHQYEVILALILDRDIECWAKIVCT